MNSISPRLEVYLKKKKKEMKGEKWRKGGVVGGNATSIADFNAKVAESTKNSGSLKENQICIAVNAIVMSKCSTELDLLACTMQSYISLECF